MVPQLQASLSVRYVKDFGFASYSMSRRTCQMPLSIVPVVLNTAYGKCVLLALVAVDLPFFRLSGNLGFLEPSENGHFCPVAARHSSDYNLDGVPETRNADTPCPALFLAYVGCLHFWSVWSASRRRGSAGRSTREMVRISHHPNQRKPSIGYINGPIAEFSRRLGVLRVKATERKGGNGTVS
jgi:hypothetical protein